MTAIKNRQRVADLALCAAAAAVTSLVLLRCVDSIFEGMGRSWDQVWDMTMVSTSVGVDAVVMGTMAVGSYAGGRLPFWLRLGTCGIVAFICVYFWGGPVLFHTLQVLEGTGSPRMVVLRAAAWFSLWGLAGFFLGTGLSSVCQGFPRSGRIAVGFVALAAVASLVNMSYKPLARLESFQFDFAYQALQRVCDELHAEKKLRGPAPHAKPTPQKPSPPPPFP